MNYTIDILDTQNDDLPLSLEIALRSSINLDWLGGDQKDELIIVGSSLAFSMIDTTASDGAYDALFTGDETRFKVRLYDENEVTIWTGFLLPDSYNEPYSKGNVPVSFSATDGLGRLKGKYLSDDFYEEEKSVIEIISACLAQTGLGLDMYFTPAIENSLERDYRAIYLDGDLFVKDDSKNTCYEILEALLKDMICCVYQCDDRWYVDALNKRQMLALSYKHYAADGTFVGAVDVTRLLKNSQAIVTPSITIVAPYGEITARFEQTPQTLPATINDEANDGWAVLNGVNGEIYATDWVGYGDYYAKAIAPDYEVSLPFQVIYSIDILDNTRFLGLRKKLYVSTSEKYSFKFKFRTEISLAKNKDEGTFYENLMRGEVLLNDEIIQQFNVVFDAEDNEEEVEVSFDIIAQTYGLMDIKIYQPYVVGVFLDLEKLPKTVIIEEFEFEEIGFEEIQETSDVINEDYTQKKDIEVTYADDKNGVCSAFRLAKLDVLSDSYNEIAVPIQYGFTQDASNYSVVDLAGANLMKDNIEGVYYNDVLLQDVEVIYNYIDGEQMVLKTNSLINTGEFKVRVHPIIDVNEDRTYWEQWTDSVYQIETNRYIDCVADVHRRMFNIPHPKIDMLLNQNVKMNDIISFPYRIVQNYYLTNCTWHIDKGETSITAVKGYYKNDVTINPDDNIPPIVETISKITIAEGITNASLTSISYDPDGFIVSVLWEQVSGDTTATIETPTTDDTILSGLTGDNYTFRVTVTDNEGATGTAEVVIERNHIYEVNLTETANDYVTLPTVKQEKTFALSTTPNLRDGISLTLNIVAYMKAWHTSFNIETSAKIKVVKNDILIYDGYLKGLIVASEDADDVAQATENVTFNFINTDVINVQLISEAEEVNTATYHVFYVEESFTVETVSVSGGGEVSNLPVQILGGISGSF